LQLAKKIQRLNVKWPDDMYKEKEQRPAMGDGDCDHGNDHSRRSLRGQTLGDAAAMTSRQLQVMTRPPREGRRGKAGKGSSSASKSKGSGGSNGGKGGKGGKGDNRTISDDDSVAGGKGGSNGDMGPKDGMGMKGMKGMKGDPSPVESPSQTPPIAPTMLPSIAQNVTRRPTRGPDAPPASPPIADDDSSPSDTPTKAPADDDGPSKKPTKKPTEAPSDDAAPPDDDAAPTPSDKPTKSPSAAPKTDDATTDDAPPSDDVVERVPTASPIEEGPTLEPGTYKRCYPKNSTIVPCPEPDLAATCDKYNPDSSFSACFEKCVDSFCCIHDSQATRSLSCSKEYNCNFYKPCYIVWFKLHDTIGPAPYIRLKQSEAFYDVNDDDFNQLIQDDPEFYNQFLGHHFMTDDLPLTDDTFVNPDNW
jgi:hypothetical protein